MILKRTAAFLYTYAVIIYLELGLKLLTVGYADSRFIYTLIFCIPFACTVYLPTLLSDGKTAKIVFNTVLFVISFFFAAQAVYFVGMNEYMPLSMISMGGAAFNKFGTQALLTLKEGFVYFIILIIPVPLTAFLTAKELILFKKTSVNVPLIISSIALTVHMLGIWALTLGGTDVFSVYDAYYSEDITTDVSVHNLGVLTTTRLEVQNMLFGTYDDGGDGVTQNTNRQWSDEYNVESIDLEKMREIMAEDEEASALFEKLIARTPTKKNEYTGYFEGYNLISICAEAYSPELADPELTPTLYKLSNEGFVFSNYYGSFETVTTDGEYAFCMGMFPDTSRWASESTFAASDSNTLPYALGNMFSDIGADTFAYHSFTGLYYSRNTTHPNMGYSVFKTPDSGLPMEMGMPSSDLEMMMVSVDDYISSGNQFHAYYMTFSGHYQYDWNNEMSAKNRDKVEHLEYSEEVKAYIACNLELEYALSYLIERLEEAGIAEKTVIVLTNDHYPYGLTDEQFAELAGGEPQLPLDKYKGSFICWSASMKESVTVDKYCCTVDILPTVLNLFGFEYDSRFIMGRDILAEGEGVAILSDQSFICREFRFDAKKNTVIAAADAEISDLEIQVKKNEVRQIMASSADIFNTDLYRYCFISTDN